MDTIITKDRIKAASHINRWRGWTTRPYSILEHMVIGTWALRYIGADTDAQRAFLIHDLHETEIVGDVPRPDKARYMNERFHDECRLFDMQLADELKITQGWSLNRNARDMDMMMMVVEHEFIAVPHVPSLDHFDQNDRPQRFIADCIVKDDASGEKAIDAWFVEYKRLFS